MGPKSIMRARIYHHPKTIVLTFAQLHAQLEEVSGFIEEHGGSVLIIDDQGKPIATMIPFDGVLMEERTDVGQDPASGPRSPRRPREPKP